MHSPGTPAFSSQTCERVMQAFNRTHGPTIDLTSLTQVMQTIDPVRFGEGYVTRLLEQAGLSKSSNVDLYQFFSFLFDEHWGNPHRGVSVSHMASQLLNHMRMKGQSRHAKVYEIEPTIIRPIGASLLCPRDGELGRAYVDSIFGEQNAGLSQFMLSYTWGYGVGDIVDSLRSFCDSRGLELSRTYVWVCCLCINQHRVKAAQSRGEVVPFSEFQKAFGARVGDVGHILAMMSPWNNPVYISRVWCDFEMFTAVHEVKAEVTIIMPPREAEDLRATLLRGGGLEKVWHVLTSLDVEQAQASVETDRCLILKMISEGPGYHQLNSIVAESLQKWILDASEGHILHSLKDEDLDSETTARLCNEVGDLLAATGSLDRAEYLLEKAKKLREVQGTLENCYEGAVLMSNLGNLMDRRGNLDGALETYELAQKIHVCAGTLESPEGAKLFRRRGKIVGDQGDLKRKLELYLEARRIREATNSLYTPDGADLLSNIGAAMRQAGNMEGAIESYAKAVHVREETQTLMTPGGATLLSNIGFAKWKATESAEDKEKAKHLKAEAKEAYQRARMIRERTGTMETAAGATLLVNMVDLEPKRGKRLELYMEALSIRNKTGTLDTAGGAVLLSNVGSLKFANKDYAAAREHYEQARAIRDKTGTLATNAGAILLSKLADTWSALGDAAAALVVLIEAKGIREQAGSLKTEAGVKLLLRIGCTQLAQSDAHTALFSFTDARQILFEESLSLDSSQQITLQILEEIASAQSALGNTEGALKALVEAKCIHEKLDSLKTEKGVKLLERVSSLQLSEGNGRGALASLKHAQHILLGEGTNMDSSQELLFQLLQQIATVQTSLGETVAAALSMEEAQRLAAAVAPSE